MPRLKNDKPTAAWKIALVPLLLIGLVWNVTRSSEDIPPVAAGDRSIVPDTATESPSDVLSVADVLRELERTRQADEARPALSLEEIVRHDPFAMVGELASRAGLSTASVAIADGLRTADPEVAAETRTLTTPVKAVLNGPNGAVALVDSRIVRVGDFLEPHMRVVAIESDAIVVELGSPVDALSAPSAGEL